LRRHGKRKTPCKTTLTESITGNGAQQNGNGGQQNGHGAQQNGNGAQQNGNGAQQNGNGAQQNGNGAQQNGNVFTYCTNCKTKLSSKQSYDRHQAVCRGVEKNVCIICLKVFSSRQSRTQHMRTVKCFKPIVPVGSPSKQTVMNQKASIINNTVDNSKTLNITLNFGEEALEKMCNEPEYLTRMEQLVRLGKYALPQHISDIYFNDSFPLNNTIQKTRHKDKFVKIKTGDNEWNLRAMDDVYKTLTDRMESYMTPYFAYMEHQMERVYDEDRVKFKQMTKNIREFGHKVLWLDWKCDDIRQIGVELKEPYCENERQRRIQEMKNMLLEHIYDKTRELLSL